MNQVKSHQQLRLGALKVTHLTGVGAKLQEHLQKCHIITVQDILFHLPFRYQDRTHITPIIRLQHDDWAVCEGIIEKQEVRQGARKILQCQLNDGSGVMNLCFFNFNSGIQTHLAVGKTVRCFGQVRLTGFGKQMTHPECDIITDNKPIAGDDHLTPIYSTTNGLSQKQWYKLTDQALALLAEKGRLDELIPEPILAKLQLPDLNAALQYVHRPPVGANIKQLEERQHPCQLRLVFEELLAHQFAVLRHRKQAHSLQAPPFNHAASLQQSYISQLPFKPTNAQQRVIAEIQQDVKKNVPMLRLVQGDVGSGKTVVAASACLFAIESGFQAAFMAPTEILAEQHFQTVTKWFAPLGIQTAWLTGKLNAKEKRTMLELISSGEALCVMGTHALFQEKVHFNALGLVVIDEQHRFGVHQRLALRNKGVEGDNVPHQLIMTATPIPRTLAMTAYTDLDCSILDELPPGRTPVTTVVLNNQRRTEVISRIHSHTEAGNQCYWVCPFIEESESLQCEAALETYELLKTALPTMRIGLIHGRLKSAEKEAMMLQFKQNQFDVLVATTVIEVGVDVPNATLMIIENAERLGLSQLHQLRGRVGRGAAESFCILLYQAPLSFHARERLALMRSTQDGFVIAEKDLEQRGPGEVLGTRQTGLARLRIADLQRDVQLIGHAQEIARELFSENHPCIPALVNRWLANQEEFGHV